MRILFYALLIFVLVFIAVYFRQITDVANCILAEQRYCVLEDPLDDEGR